MGIGIGIRLSPSLTQEQWEPVYQEALALAQKLPLGDFRKRSIHGHNITCMVPIEENDKGWRCTGDLVSHKTIEWYEFPRTLGDLDLEAHPDPLLCMANGIGLIEQYISEKEYNRIAFKVDKDGDGKNIFKNYRSIWGDKTQGFPSHIPLLAIACLVQDRLGPLVHITGDVTAGQCKHAVDITREFCGVDMRIPAQADPERWMQRVCAIDIPEPVKIAIAIRYYLGKLDAHFGNLLRSAFSDDGLRQYWKKELHNISMKTYGFKQGTKQYFSMGFDLSDLCDLVSFKYHDKWNREFVSKGTVTAGSTDAGSNATAGSTDTVSNTTESTHAESATAGSTDAGDNDTDQTKVFIETLLHDNRLHVKEKKTADLVTGDPDSPYLESISILMARYLVGGAINYSADRYIPIDEIRSVLRDKIGMQCDDLIDQQLAIEQKMDEEGTPRNFAELIQQQSSEHFDIEEADYLFQYTKDCSIGPSAYRGLRACMKFRKEMLDDYGDKSYEWKLNTILRNSSNFRAMTEDEWNSIFDKLEEDPTLIDRYFPFFLADLSAEAVHNAIISLVVIDDLYDYAMTIPLK